MFRPTPAATSRVRSPSKPRSAIWLKAARTRASSRSSLCDRTGCLPAAALISLSIKHLIERWVWVRCKGAMLASKRRWANVQTITRGGDATGAGSPEGESLLSRQAGVEPSRGGRCAGPDVRAVGGQRFRVVPQQWEAVRDAHTDGDRGRGR